MASPATAPSLKPFSLLSFDVYGTLIDWETGIYTAALPLIERSSPTTSTLNRQEFLTLYNTLEFAEQSAAPGTKYSAILSRVYLQLASSLSLPNPPQEEADAFGASIKDWPAFPDTVDALKRLKKYFKLVVLSNTDNESFARTLKHLGGEGTFDAVFTAEDIGSYKPDLKNFEYMLREVKERFGIEKDAVLQTAQSRIHDHIPAQIMGIRSAWISRYGASIGGRVGEVDDEEDEEVKIGGYEWRWDTLGEMADAVEKEFGPDGR